MAPELKLYELTEKLHNATRVWRRFRYGFTRH